MKKNVFLRGLTIFLCSMGTVFTVGIVFLLLTDFTAISTFGTVLGLVKTQSLYSIKSGDMITGAGAGIVSALRDPYSQYLDPSTWQDLKEKIDAKFNGIGVYLIQDESGRLIILSPIEGTPAYKAGLKNDDIIITINGESTASMTQDKAVSLMKGEPGTELDLVIYRESEKKQIDFKIIRESINVPSVHSQAVKDHPEAGYVRLNQFSTHSDQELADSINRILADKKVKGLILDLRNNGGGDFEVAISISSLFLDNKDVVSVADADGNKSVRKSTSGGLSLPLVVLINKNSASASEILAGALHDNNRAVLVGEKTYGKGVVQTVFPLPDGGALKLTTQKYFTPKGTDINKIGIQPDDPVENDAASDQDKQLDRAVQVLDQQLKNGQ
ncbi:MAG TPA: S41 family peptidase [Syntrophomonadaceae bacterium]|nr:S41 family peptidase [Syntrophomonadaceae bacterium]